jgi:hypothetical protein
VKIVVPPYKPDESVKREHMKFDTAAEVNDIKENNESENQTAVVTGQDNALSFNTYLYPDFLSYLFPLFPAYYLLLPVFYPSYPKLLSFSALTFIK